MKRGYNQTAFFITIGILTLLTLFILQFEITGNVVNNNWCEGADINQNGIVDNTDLKYIQDYWATATANCNYWAPPYNSYCERSDLNEDGIIGLGDLVLVNNQIEKTDCAGGEIKTTTSTTPICGNGVKEAGEQCDKSDLREQTCISQGYDGGFLYCYSDCNLNYIQCTITTIKTDTTNNCEKNTGYKCYSGIGAGGICEQNNKEWIDSLDSACGTGKACCKPLSTTTTPTTTICGTADGKILTTQPTTNLCTSPAYLEGSVSLIGTTWTWTCHSAGTSATETCSATKQTTTPQICSSSGYTCGLEKPTKQESCESIYRVYLGNNTLDISCSTGITTGCCGNCLYGFNEANGLCYNVAQTCSKLKGNICTSNEECSGGNWMTASDNNRCCKTTCTASKEPSGGSEKQKYSPSATALKSGYTRELKLGDEIEFTIEGEDHTLTITRLTSTTAKIKITSNTFEEFFKEGDTRKYDITGDNGYDLKVKLNSVTSSKAEITIWSIKEKFNTQTQVQQRDDNEDAKEVQIIESGESSEESKVWIYVIVLIVILIIFVFLMLFLAYKRRQKYEKY